MIRKDDTKTHDRALDRCPAWAVITVAALASLLLAAPASAQVTERNRATSESSDSKSPFRGSSVSFEQSVAHRTLQPNDELTYDPYYNLELEVAPYWWFVENWYVSGSFSVSQEITHSNVTTKENELWASDTRLRAGTPRLVRIPTAKIDVSLGAEAVLPTSKPSIARTMTVATGLFAGLSRRFSVMKGLTVSYNGRAQKRFHRYQTRSLETPRIDGCADLARGCDPYAHTGQRNASFRHVHLGSVSLSPIRQLTFSATGGVYVDHLYSAADAGASAEAPIEGSNVRHTSLWLLNTTYRPMGWMGITGGLRTVHPQLAPDSTYYAPGFNRYSEWTLDVSVDVPSLVGTL